MNLDDDFALPTPLTSTTPVPRLRAASASRRMVENLKSFRNKMEPTAAVERGDTHTLSSSTSFSDSYAFTTQQQPVYSPPHLPRCRTWLHCKSPGFGHQDGDGGSGIVSDTNTDTDNDTGTRLDHGHGSGRWVQPQARSRSSLFDGLSIITTKIHSMIPGILIQVSKNPISLGSGSDPSVGYINVNGHGHIHPSSRRGRSQSSLAPLLNISATDANDNVDEALAGLVHRIPSRSRSVRGKGKRTMNERIGSEGDGGERKEKDKDGEREDRDRKRV
ncbi:hypothetical protein F5050DRAFT_1189684 [Lentinula boryana]|uniref:Uncharacterized protein n=1 Tax=Lentinula boryana TaxID=40481 RepID=A0ABQ8PYH7_9AGAR|nr:hypothetical protein F5050DRAFT_1189684 [Lentinula boryana]